MRKPTSSSNSCLCFINLLVVYRESPGIHQKARLSVNSPRPLPQHQHAVQLAAVVQAPQASHNILLSSPRKILGWLPPNFFLAWTNFLQSSGLWEPSLMPKVLPYAPRNALYLQGGYVSVLAAGRGP